MVVKISKTNSVEAVVAYNTRKVEDGKASILSSSLISSKADAALTQVDIVAAFQGRISLNHRTTQTMTHISLNPDPKETLSDTLLTKVAEDFLEQLGYGDQPYIMVKHEDIDRPHVHIVVCNIDENGRKIDDSFEKKRSNDIRKSLERKYHLLVAEEQRNDHRYTVQRADAGKGNHFAQIRDIAGKVATEYAYSSLAEYRTLLSAYNISVRVVENAAGQPVGLLYGIGGDFSSPPIADKAFEGTGLRLESVEKRVRENREQVKQASSPALKKVVQGLMALDSLEELRKQSGRLKLEFCFRQGEDGRVYGLSIIDHKKKAVYKASDLGREFSARHWQKFFERSAEEPASAAVTAAEATKVTVLSDETAAKGKSGAGDLVGIAEVWGYEDGRDEPQNPIQEQYPTIPVEDDMDGEPSWTLIDALVSQGSLIDTSAWGGGGSSYKPDKKKKRKKKQNL